MYLNLKTSKSWTLEQVLILNINHDQSRRGLHIDFISGLTATKTPKLEARKRNRPVTAISIKQMEEQEVESIKQYVILSLISIQLNERACFRYHFHAQPLNTKILNGPADLPKAEKKPVTKPIGFEFETDKRIENSVSFLVFIK